MLHLFRLRVVVPLAAIPFIWWALASPLGVDGIFGLYSFTRFVGALALTYGLVWITYVAAGHESASLRIVRCALATSTVLVCYGLLEAAAAVGIVDYRAVLPRSEKGTDPPPLWERPEYRLDPELLYIRRPWLHLAGTTMGGIAHQFQLPTERRYSYDVQYDSRGFRNDHEIAQAPIVVIGDSLVEAMLVPKEALLSSRLSQVFGVEVANLGQEGYGPQQELAVVRRYALALRPRVVVWVFFEGNDLYDARRYAERIQDWDATLQEINRFDKRSFIINALFGLRDLTSPTPTTMPDKARRWTCEFTRSQSEEGRTLYFQYTGMLTAYEQEGWGATENALLTAQRLVGKSGAELLLVYLPVTSRVYQDYCRFSADAYAREWHFSEMPGLMAGWAAENQIAYLDLTGPLKAAAARGELVFFPDDTHWTAAGNEVAATVIGWRIADAGWLR